MSFKDITLSFRRVILVFFREFVVNKNPRLDDQYFK